MNALSRAEVGAVVASAVSAPSVLNTQPWRFRARAASRDQFDEIELWADPGRGLVELDPEGRELLISCGAALYNLRLAMAVLGHETTCEVLPDQSEPSLIARVTVVGVHRPTEDEDQLFAVVPTRRTSREPFLADDVPDSVIDQLVPAAESNGARLDEADEWHRTWLTGLIREADRAQQTEPQAVREVGSWVGDQAPSEAGISTDRLGPRSLDPNPLVRDFAMGRHTAGREAARFPHEGRLFVLLTPADSPKDRVAAGVALEHVWLQATSHGVSVSLNTSPTESPGLRPWIRDPASPIGIPQLVLRLGYGPSPSPTRRRAVSDVLEFDELVR
jgi:hypothetical protein